MNTKKIVALLIGTLLLIGAGLYFFKFNPQEEVEVVEVEVEQG